LLFLDLSGVLLIRLAILGRPGCSLSIASHSLFDHFFIVDHEGSFALGPQIVNHALLLLALMGELLMGPVTFVSLLLLLDFSFRPGTLRNWLFDNKLADLPSFRTSDDHLIFEQLCDCMPHGRESQSGVSRKVTEREPGDVPVIIVITATQAQV
jgi:hypothetical protein